VQWILSQFGKQRPSAQQRYKAFVADGVGRASPWEQLKGQVLLGDERFVERLRPALQSLRSSKEVPRQQRHAGRPALARLFTAGLLRDRARRDARICEAHVDHGYSLSEIGGAVGLHYSTVSRIVSREEANAAESPAKKPRTR
jgi:putative transposase